MLAEASSPELEVEDPIASDHGFCKRLRLAYSMAGPWLAQTVVSSGKDLYVLKFGASAERIGIILLACSFACPVMDCVLGNLQDRGSFFSRWMPLSSWGRRAPWYMTHNAALVPLLFAFFFPPSHELWALHAWFGLLLLLGYWCVSACLTAFEAARVELYPGKGRVILQQYCEFTVSFGVGVGSGAIMFALTYTSKFTCLISGLVCSLVVLAGFMATGVLRETKACPVINDNQGSLQNFLGAFRSTLVVRMIVMRLVQGISQSILPALMLYYLTFEYKLDKEVRSLWFIMGMASMGIVELSSAVLWSRLFTKYPVLMFRVPLLTRMAGAVLLPILLTVWKSPVAFVLFLGLWRLCVSNYCFWQVAACGWICDQEGRGEGTLLGLFGMTNNFGKAFAGSLAIWGLGWAGLVTRSCMQETEELRMSCEESLLHTQPESLSTYLQVMICWATPVVELIMCALLWEFPIRPGSARHEETESTRRDAVSRALRAQHLPQQ